MDHLWDGQEPDKSPQKEPTTRFKKGLIKTYFQFIYKQVTL